MSERQAESIIEALERCEALLQKLVDQGTNPDQDTVIRMAIQRMISDAMPRVKQ